MKSKLRAHLAANAKRGSFRAEDNTIYIYDMIVSNEIEAEWFGGVSPQAFVAAIAGLSGDLAIRINSPGGDVFAAVAITQAMRDYTGNITVHVDGYAASAASVIAVAAPKVIMAPGSFMMIHKAWTIEAGNADDFLATAGLLEKIDGSIAEAYARKSGGDVQEYTALMAKETWFSADEAVSAGLADEIAADQPKPMANWDLSAFQAAPSNPDPVVERVEETPPPSDDTERRVRAHQARMLATAA
jgi:ATP-dependent protease ClpP protease subunit